MVVMSGCTDIIKFNAIKTFPIAWSSVTSLHTDQENPVRFPEFFFSGESYHGIYALGVPMFQYPLSLFYPVLFLTSR